MPATPQRCAPQWTWQPSTECVLKARTRTGEQQCPDAAKIDRARRGILTRRRRVAKPCQSILQKSRSEPVGLVVLGGRRCVTRRRRDDKSLSDIQQLVADGCSPKQRTGCGKATRRGAAVCCRTRCLPLPHEHSEHGWADRRASRGAVQPRQQRRPRPHRRTRPTLRRPVPVGAAPAHRRDIDSVAQNSSVATSFRISRSIRSTSSMSDHTVCRCWIIKDRPRAAK
ncbi:MAG: hypothetical protein JWR32_1925 [Mycobacterium sp.]|jgi:hypothetical protein|nr:hypothetical protein [Mycobacterium sp.]